MLGKSCFRAAHTAPMVKVFSLSGGVATGEVVIQKSR